MNSQRYRIKSEARGPAYEALIRYCAIAGASCSLVDLLPTSKKAQTAREAFLQQAQPHLIRTEMVTRWPLGSTDAQSDARGVPLWLFGLNPLMIELLIDSARGIYGWTAGRNLPEDLAVYRADGSIFLGTVAHEHIGWMNLTPEEAADRRLGLIELR